MVRISIGCLTAIFVLKFVDIALLHAKAATHVISSPVANLLAEPHDYERTAPVGAHDTPKLLAQLLYNESVAVVRIEGPWSFVSAPSLMVFSKDTYVPLYGWVKNDSLRGMQENAVPADMVPLICIAPWTTVYKKIQSDPHKFQPITALSYDTRLVGIEKEQEWWKIAWIDGEEAWVPAPCVMEDAPKTEAALRDMIVAHARQFLGTPYCWGGCSAFHPSKKRTLSGFDCSGFVYRLLHVAGKTVPRNSRSQFTFATPREPSRLKAGDVLFLSVADISPHICHVMLYVGKGNLIEAWSARTDNGIMNVQPLREVSVKERLGKPIHQIKNGERVGRFVCYGGTFFD